MKKILLVIPVLILMGAGCGSVSVPQSEGTPVPLERDQSDLREEDKSMDQRDGDTSKLPAVEEELGIDLPDDSGITTVLDNDLSYSVSGRTSESSEILVQRFKDEMTNLGFQAKRPFGTVSFEGTESAVYSGNGQTWAIFRNN